MARGSETTREQVIEVARGVLVAEGADAVTMRRLAAELGTSYQVVYSRVGAKPEVLRAVHDLAFENLTAQVDALDPTLGTDEHLHALTAGYLRFAVANPRLFEVMFGSPTGLVRDQALQEVERESFRRCWVTAARAWLDAHRPRRPAGSAAPLAWRLWTATHGIAVLHLAGHGSPSSDVLRDLAGVVELVLVEPLAASTRSS
ncbi:TetR/AcrR family transcriptional regulator [Nocardioides acrostichi]|uniref:WHG domain-containing protein n=1 Tax=Nocardioides acrostichi TaxID=2784339 RepID=A0A930Y5A2_9ACTN|nr:TetR-like C-terminal domain-containing protein [Nocardioides acrostichi]MBF4161045.1 WHG domain-containing protein [Nocardioides acrostichi]